MRRRKGNSRPLLRPCVCSWNSMILPKIVRCHKSWNFSCQISVDCGKFLSSLYAELDQTIPGGVRRSQLILFPSKALHHLFPIQLSYLLYRQLSLFRQPLCRYQSHRLLLNPREYLHRRLYLRHPLLRSHQSRQQSLLLLCPQLLNRHCHNLTKYTQHPQI